MNSDMKDPKILAMILVAATCFSVLAVYGQWLIPA